MSSPNNTIDELQAHIEILRTLYFITSPLSICSSLFIIITFLKPPRVFFKLTHIQFILCQSICDLMFSTKFLIQATYSYSCWYTVSDLHLPIHHLVPTDKAFLALAMVGQFSMVGTVLWSATISIIVIRLFMLKPFNYDQYSRHNPHCFPFFTHLFIWTFATGTTLFPAIYNFYGPTTNGPWIDGHYPMIRLAIFIIPVFICFLLTIAVLILVCVKMDVFSMRAMYMRELDGELGIRDKIPTHKILFIYGLVFVIFWTPPVILRTLQVMGIESQVFIYGDIFCVSGQGFANAFVWGLFFFKKGEGCCGGRGGCWMDEGDRHYDTIN